MPHNEAPTVEYADIEDAIVAFIIGIENGTDRQATPAEAQAMRLVSASA
jgi:hypothetical protein